MVTSVNNHNTSVAMMNIKSKYPDAVFEKGKLIFRKYNVLLAFQIDDFSRKNGIFTAKIIFEAEHPFLDIPSTDIYVSTGKTPEDTVNSAIDSYLTCTLESIFRSLDNSAKDTITSEYANKKHVFYLPSERSSVIAGNTDQNYKELFSVIKQDIPKYLGSRKAYWISLLASCADGNVYCQASINNSISYELTSLLSKYASGWNEKQTYHSQKEYILLIQDDSTYEKYPFSFKQISDYTSQTIEIMKKSDDISWVLEKIIDMCGDRNLAVELCFFIPEIYCSSVMSINELDDIKIRTGESILLLKKSQISSYGYIEKSIASYIDTVHPSKDESLKILRFSSKLSAVSKAVNDGSKVKDLILSGLCFNVYDDYIPR